MSSEDDSKYDKLKDGYSYYFTQSNGEPLPQPGILPPQLASMGFIFVKLKDDAPMNVVLNLLVGLQNIQIPPYTSENSQRFPWDSNKDKLNDNFESMLLYAQRTSNLLPSNVLHINFGFGYNIWVNKWKQNKPNGFLPFSDWDNKYDKISSLPFSNNKESKYYRKHFQIPKYNDEYDYDIIMQIKSASTALINRVYAHFILLFKNLCESFELKLGECKQRNQFGFFDAASEAEHTANPTTCVSSVNRAWNNDNKTGAIKRKKYGDQYVDLGRYNTVLIGKEAEADKDKDKDKQFKNGTFGVFCEFVHDLNKWHKLTVNEQDKTFGRQKKSGAFVQVPKTKSHDAGSKHDPNPLNGNLNEYLPHSHIVRTHIRGVSKLQCPFATRKELNKTDSEHTWLFPDPQQNPINVDNNLEPSTIPMQMYRQAASFSINENLKGLHFFGFSRDCHLMDDLFSRMIGQSSTVADVPHANKIDPVLGKNKDGQKFWQVDSLLQYTVALGASYFYFPNFNVLLSMAKWPTTQWNPNVQTETQMKDFIFDNGMNALNWNLGLNTQLVKNRKGDGTHVNWGVNFVSDIISFYGMLRFSKMYRGGPVPPKKQTHKNDGDKSSNQSQGYMQSDPLKWFMLNIADTSIEVVWNQINKNLPNKIGSNGVTGVPISKKNRVVIVGGGCSGLVCGYELKKIGFDVKILEISDVVGGRVKTFRFSNGIHAEAGAMRLPGDADPTKRGISHWLTDYYIDLFDLEVAPFHNDDPNALIKILKEGVYKQRQWEKSAAIKVENKLWNGWKSNIKKAIKEIEKIKQDTSPHSEYSNHPQLYEDQLTLLQSINTLETYSRVTNNVITDNLIRALDRVEGMSAKVDNMDYAKYVSAIKVWDIWVKRWSRFSGIEYLRTGYNPKWNVKGNEILSTSDEYRIKFMGLRPWPEVAIRGLLIVQYMPSYQSASLVELLRDSFGNWWMDPMHTLRDGMDVLPRSFVNANLWGPQAKANKDWMLENDVQYGENVYKIAYNKNGKNKKNSKNDKSDCTVYTRNTQTNQIREYDCDYVIITTPLPTIQNMQFDPPLSNFKQEAIRMTRYEESTKVLLQFKERFWEYNIMADCKEEKQDNENDDDLPHSSVLAGTSGGDCETPDNQLLPRKDIILGGHSYSTQTSSQIVYPTPIHYQFAQNDYKPYINWSYADAKHLDDGSRRGILVSYTWGYEAQRLASLSENEALRIVLNQIATLHSEARFGKNKELQEKYYNKILNSFESGKRMAWSTNEYMGGGAFVLFAPFNYLDYWRDLIRVPEGVIKLNDIYSVNAETLAKEANSDFYNKIDDKVNSFKTGAQWNKEKYGDNSDKLIGTVGELKGTIISSKLKSMSVQKDKKDAVEEKDIEVIEELRETLERLDKLQDLKLYFGGEGISWTNGWIQGAMESSMRVIYQIYDNYQMQFNPNYIGNRKISQLIDKLDDVMVKTDKK